MDNPPLEEKKERNDDQRTLPPPVDVKQESTVPNESIPADGTLLPEPLPLTRFHKVMLGGTISLTYFMMAKYFGVSVLAVQWVASAYQLAYVSYSFATIRARIQIYYKQGCGLLVSGRLADLYGRKKLIIIGLVIGVIANIISGAIPNRVALTIFRAIAGLGLSISAPAGFGIIGITFREEPSRTMAFAALGLGTPLGAVIGESIGGVTCGIWRKGWQYLYFLIAEFGIIPIISGIIYIPPDNQISKSPNTLNTTDGQPIIGEGDDYNTDTNSGKVDWIGTGLITMGLSLLLFSITQAGLVEKGWKTAYIPPTFTISIILIITFGLWEYKLEHSTRDTSITSNKLLKSPPIVRLSIFTRHKWKLTAILGIAFFDWMGVCGWVYLTSVYYQDLLDYSPLKNALCILPAPITGIICSYLVTLAAPRISAPILLALGGISTGLANCLLAIQSKNTIYWRNEFFGATLQPFGGDLTIPIGSIMISNSCDDDEQSIAGALFQIAGTLDLCLSLIILTEIESSSGLLHGLRVSLWFNVACCWFVLVIIFSAFRKVGLAKDIAKTV